MLRMVHTGWCASGRNTEQTIWPRALSGHSVTRRDFLHLLLLHSGLCLGQAPLYFKESSAQSSVSEGSQSTSSHDPFFLDHGCSVSARRLSYSGGIFKQFRKAEFLETPNQSLSGECALKKGGLTGSWCYKTNVWHSKGFPGPQTPFNFAQWFLLPPIRDHLSWQLLSSPRHLTQARRCGVDISQDEVLLMPRLP